MSEDVVDGEIVDGPGSAVEPAKPRWVPKGKAAAALAGELTRYDPDGRLSAEALALIREGESKSTIDTLEYQAARYLLWCLETNREYLPATYETVVEWILANWTMKYPEGHQKAGQLRGRRGQPYSPNTVRLSLSAIARMHRRHFSRNPAALARYYAEHPGELEASVHRLGRQRGAMPTPTAHEDVTKAMKAYARRWKQAGFREDLAATITPDELFAMVRTCDLETVQGLRDAFLLRLAAETGRRNSELMSLDWKDLRWETPTRLIVTIPFSKTNQEAEAGDEAVVEADDFLCPELDTLLLGREWKELCAARGFTSGPVFRKVRGTGQRRKDGGHRGVILPARMERKNYVDVVTQAARLAGVDRDPVTGDERKVVPHSLRVYMASNALGAGVTIGTVCDQGGWSRKSPVVLRYDRLAKRRGQSPGAVIRRAVKAARDAAAAEEESNE